ncbi:hypothetical protein C7M84_015860 [Penaeus vannamei]|uniref:Uncharacterized protein n=1 Tax=Penaeus vannamei TaxID=6689 RepID=A0A3R7QFW2_PENVA|nr:hypothetical protein C7M84_015860 [Penaeus vannamei]
MLSRFPPSYCAIPRFSLTHPHLPSLLLSSFSFGLHIYLFFPPLLHSLFPSITYTLFSFLSFTSSPVSMHFCLLPLLALAPPPCFPILLFSLLLIPVPFSPLLIPLPCPLPSSFSPFCFAFHRLSISSQSCLASCVLPLIFLLSLLSLFTPPCLTHPRSLSSSSSAFLNFRDPISLLLLSSLSPFPLFFLLSALSHFSRSSFLFLPSRFFPSLSPLSLLLLFLPALSAPFLSLLSCVPLLFLSALLVSLPISPPLSLFLSRRSVLAFPSSFPLSSPPPPLCLVPFLLSPASLPFSSLIPVLFLPSLPSSALSLPSSFTPLFPLLSLSHRPFLFLLLSPPPSPLLVPFPLFPFLSPSSLSFLTLFSPSPPFPLSPLSPSSSPRSFLSLPSLPFLSLFVPFLFPPSLPPPPSSLLVPFLSLPTLSPFPLFSRTRATKTKATHPD